MVPPRWNGANDLPHERGQHLICSASSASTRRPEPGRSDEGDLSGVDNYGWTDSTVPLAQPHALGSGVRPYRDIHRLTTGCGSSISTRVSTTSPTTSCSQWPIQHFTIDPARARMGGGGSPRNSRQRAPAQRVGLRHPWSLRRAWRGQVAAAAPPLLRIFAWDRSGCCSDRRLRFGL